MPPIKKLEHNTPTGMVRPDSGQGANDVSARRQRKREIDRRCQRQARERTKSRIAYLERLVEDLQQQDAGGRIEALMKQLAKVEKERDFMAQTLKDVHNVLSNHRIPTEIENTQVEDADRQSSESVHDNSSTTSTHRDTQAALTPATQSVESVIDATEPQSTITCHHRQHTPIFDSLPTITTSPELENDPIVPKSVSTCDCGRDEPGQDSGPKNLWRYANTTLLQRYKVRDVIPAGEDFMTDDVAVRVILQGWDTVQSESGLTKSWAILRRIDDALFFRCHPIERLAILKTMHMLLQYHRSPTPERYAKLPSWYLQRPSQSMAHSYAINYFVWPGLRERFVFHQHRYCSNLFWYLLASGLQIQWPYAFRDCFVQHADNGLYQISPHFQACISDISKWAMSGDMFNQYPELRSDIPSALSVPKAIPNTLQMQLAGVDPRDFRQVQTDKDERNRSFSVHSPTYHHQVFEEVERRHSIPMSWSQPDQLPDFKTVPSWIT